MVPSDFFFGTKIRVRLLTMAPMRQESRSGVIELGVMTSTMDLLKALSTGTNYAGRSIGESSDGYILFGSAVGTVVEKCKSALATGLLDLRSMEG